MFELRREAIVKSNRQQTLLKDQGNLVIWACVPLLPRSVVFMIGLNKWSSEERIRNTQNMKKEGKLVYEKGIDLHKSVRTRTYVCVGVGGGWDLSHVCYPKCHSFHVTMSCSNVFVYNVHSGFRLRSIVTAHMNVLPNNSHCGPNWTEEFHNVKLALSAKTLCFSTMRSSVDVRASTWSYCEIESSANTAERST